MFNLHPLWIVAIIVIVLIVFGPGRLPELGGAIGKGLKEFRKATNDLREEVTRASSTEEPSASPKAETASTEPPKAETPTSKS